MLQPHLKNGNVLCWNGEVSVFIHQRLVLDTDTIEIFDGMEVGSFLDDYLIPLEMSTLDFGGGK